MISQTPVRLYFVLGLILILVFTASLLVGPAAIGFHDLMALIHNGQMNTAAVIIVDIRLPRSLLAVLVGATLGLSGAALQGYLRNPLAEPGLIGVTASAALGAVIALYSGLSALFAMALPIGGIIGAFLGVGLMQLLAGRNSANLTLILAGVAVSAFSGALTSLALNLAPSPWAALEIVFWLMGSLANRSFDHVLMATPFILAGWWLLFSLRRPLDAMTLGEDTARTLGFHLPRVRLKLILGTAMSVGAATAVTGSIGFVGLIVPHLLRPWVGHRPGQLLIASALGGAILLTTADILLRLASPTQELKLGVVTAMLGAPFFLHLIIKLRRRLP